MLISPFSAIPSWEGYEYQGHIALFVVLKKISDLIKYGVDIPKSTFILEIEGADDFSIMNGDKYLTLHQVKRGAFQLSNNDKFCFVISLLQYKAQKGYFHITPQKNLPTDFVSTSYNVIKSLQAELTKKVKSKVECDKTAVFEQWAKDFIIIESITSNSSKGSIYNILKYVINSMGLEINRTNIELAKEEIAQELEKYELLLLQNGPLNDRNYVNTYDQLFDDSSTVKKASYDLIIEILDILYPEWKISISNSDTIIYPQFVYGQVLLFLKSIISECHDSGKSNCRIELSDIFYFINRNYRDELISTAFQYYIVWKSIKQSFESYPQKRASDCLNSSCIGCTNNLTCNLYKQKGLIMSIKEEEIHNFLYRLMLRRPETGRPNNLPNDDLIDRLLTCLLKEIECLGIEKNHLIQAQSNGVFYRMTLNSSGEPEELQEQLLNEMENSIDDKLLLYETDVLITDQLNEENFIYNGINTTVIGEKEFDDLKGITSDSLDKIKKNYNKAKVMRLVDRKNAKKELRK